MTDIDSIINAARAAGCSDIHLTQNMPPIVRLHGSLTPLKGFARLSAGDVGALIREMAQKTNVIDDPEQDQDYCYVSARGDRHRVNTYRQQNARATAIRLLADGIPPMEELGLPPVIAQLAMAPRGLVLVTGPTGSGKSTTLASMIDFINERRACHILTLEDPIEYAHKHKSSIVSQREVGRDAGSFAGALRSALREDPDVILVGEMRDLETISAAVTAAETGHFVLSTLHTTGAVNTIDRMIDVFPPHQQLQIRSQLSTVLKGVISQQLLPKADGTGRVAALEILLATDAVANMIREGKCYQIASVLQTGARGGMQSMDSHLASLVKSGVITEQAGFERCSDKNVYRGFLGYRN